MSEKNKDYKPMVNLVLEIPSGGTYQLVQIGRPKEKKADQQLALGIGQDFSVTFEQAMLLRPIDPKAGLQINVSDIAALEHFFHCARLEFGLEAFDEQKVKEENRLKLSMEASARRLAEQLTTFTGPEFVINSSRKARELAKLLASEDPNIEILRTGDYSGEIRHDGKTIETLSVRNEKPYLPEFTMRNWTMFSGVNWDARGDEITLGQFGQEVMRIVAIREAELKEIANDPDVVDAAAKLTRNEIEFLNEELIPENEETVVNVSNIKDIELIEDDSTWPEQFIKRAADLKVIKFVKKTGAITITEFGKAVARYGMNNPSNIVPIGSLQNTTESTLSATLPASKAAEA